MRLYLSSFRIGNRPDELLRLLGDGRRTALILNADDYKDAEARAASLKREIDELESVGLRPFEVDLRDYFGRQEALAEVLSGVDLIYVRGGSAFVLRRAFTASGADDVIRRLLADDAVVYGGYSAGPCMLGPTLRGIEGEIDNPSFVPPGYEDTVLEWDALGVLPYVVAPHYRSDHVESAEIDRSVEYFIAHHIPFIAISDGQAVVIDGDTRTVVG
ncbi:type 1 glutamine amidotransferase-like domain-containing protein [Nonomuraea sp. NN258]|uniref:Type 1 glutamine amidotransferase-like domain-containing protein n=1 Tax=Nonomuraea antri TaxID=2730852 RepID=UPI00156868E3|nr:Type 1 glutamine amidotransferase-like domain-containing protein [Nonomuraea antri]NRQ37941.1 type 1 glutamine amidotransferase-like domain-containing protein [Nonomuraea antri]